MAFARSPQTINLVLPANYRGSTTRVMAEFANHLVARGFRVVVSVPYFDHWDFVLWYLHRQARTVRNRLVMLRQWVAWLVYPALKALLVRTRWVGQAIHRVDRRVLLNRFWCVPTARNMPDADYLVTLQGYLMPHLVYLPATKGELVGSIRVDNLAGARDADPLVAEWRTLCASIEQRVKVRWFAPGEQVRQAASALGIDVEAVIPNGVNTEEFVDGGRRGGVDPVRITLFYAHHPQKGREFGCEVIRRLRWEPMAQRILVGAVGADIRQEDWPLFDVHYGYLTGGAYVKMYQETDIFVFPSLYEGFAAPPLESMACGCALVATSVQGLDEYGVHEVNCLISRPRDVETMVHHVRRLVHDVPLRDRLREGGLRTAARYSWEAATDRLIGFLTRAGWPGQALAQREAVEPTVVGRASPGSMGA